MDASAGMKARPNAKCARTSFKISCLMPTLGLKRLKLLSDGVKFVLSGVARVSVVMWSSRPPIATVVRAAPDLQVFSA